MLRTCTRLRGLCMSKNVVRVSPNAAIRTNFSPFLNSRFIQLENLNCDRILNLSHARYFSTNSVKLGKDKETKEEKVGIVQKFKKMAKDYWYVLIPVHLATSTVWLVGFYFLAKSGVDLIAILEALSVPQSVTDKLKGSEAGYYALAYACYKVATPVRYTVTVGGTTFTISKLTELGYLKTTKEMAATMKDKRDDMSEAYQAKKDEMKEKYEDMKDKYEERRDKMKEDLDEAWTKYAKKKDK